MNQLSNLKTSILRPQSLDEALKYAELIASSSICPKDLKGKSGDVLIAMQMGAEVGLSPLQAIQNIAVINGRPSLWGDAAMGVVRSHIHCQSIREWFEGNLKDSTLVAYCGVTRKGQKEEIRSFSIDQAKKAGIWGNNVWSKYPERMLQMRARGFAIRDVFADALRGLSIVEDIIDIPRDYDSNQPRLTASVIDLQKKINESTNNNDISNEIEIRSIKALDSFAKKNISNDIIFNYFGINSVKDMTENHLDILNNIKNEIKCGNISLENAFICNINTGEINVPHVDELNELINNK